MADRRKRRIDSGTDEDERKSAKTCDNKDVEDDERMKEFRVMLEKVGQLLDRDALKRLCQLQNLSANDKERIFQASCCDPLELFTILEEREKLGVSDVSCLTEDLETIGYKHAVQLIHDYLRSDRAEFEIPSEPESDYEDCKQSSARPFEDVLKAIGLEDKFPGKLHLEDFLHVRLNGSYQNVVYSFWRKITCLDYRAGLPQSLSFHYGIDCSMRDFIFSILHCADDFLRQDILEKMSACQLAIPLLLSSVRSDGSPIFLRWACGTILKKWKGKHDSFAIEQPVISHPLFTVSFLRIGEVGISKSRLLNYMLGRNQGYGSHPYFLTKECDQVQPKFSLGSIESVWFLPTAGSENEVFRDAMTFFNLRGDCLNYPKQREFACKVANLTVVLVSTDKKEDFRDLLQNINTISRHTLFVSIRENENASGRIYVRGQWRFVRRYQIEHLSAHLCKDIVNICEREEEKTALSEFDVTIVDEDGKKSDIQTANKIVDTMLRNTKRQGILSFKNKNFPLQTYWEKITKLHKERFAFDADDNKTFEEKREQKNQNVKMYRSQQLKCKHSNAMTHFLNAIKKSSTGESSVKYFLRILHGKIVQMVGESTNKDMEKIHSLEDERKKLMEMNDTASNQREEEMKMELKSQEKMKDRDRARCENLSTECKKLYEHCRVNNLGCEHFLREIGQQYEAYMAASSEDLKSIDTTLFPIYRTIAAELLLQMQPFELMDGDTECVPITWVTAVLDALRLHLNNPKVVVVSVVGVQSSGKSTLLNSMFGLRFPVRAGRCTRGLFLRLLKVDENLVKDLGFEYLIVVDTEGLRSIDHDDHTFDNKLVTFALSIANVTIFNISGENISADVAGVLQIAAHALIRMKEVDLECKCLIIQQRVSDLTAADRNKTSTHKIIETLNEATKFAAEEEGLEGRYKEFSDVVDLKFDEDLQYVPNLWAGGMAPPNHMYGEKVTKITESLLQDIRKGKIQADLTMSTFTDRVRDVWSAVKEENFIFNFQDSVRAVDFNQFCLEYNRWIVEMRQAIMNQSLKCLDIIPSLISTGRDIESLKSLLDDEEEKQSKVLKEHVEVYIGNHPRKVMILKYKQGFLEDIHFALKDAKNQALQSISEEYDIRKLEHNLPKLGGKWLARMITDIKELAQQVQTTRAFAHMEDSSMDTEVHFCHHHSHAFIELEELWKKWTKDIKEESGLTQVNITPSDIKTLCDKLLLKTTRDMAIGSEIHNLFDKEGGIEKHIDTVDFSKYINDKHVKAWIKSKQKSANSDGASCQTQHEPLLTHQIFMEKQRAVHTMQAYINESMYDLIQQKTHHFDRNIFQLLVRKTLRNLSEKTDDDRKLPHSLIAKGLMHFCARAFNEVFKHVKIRDDNFSTFFEVEDDIVYQQFTAIICHREIEKSASEFIFYYIEKELNEKLKNCMKSEILKRTAQIKLPWDILNAASTDLLVSSELFRFGFFPQCDESLSTLMETFSEQQRRNVFHDEAGRLGKNTIALLVKWEKDFSKNLSFTGWIDRLIQTFSTDSSVQQAINVYERVQPIKVSQYLRARIETWYATDCDDYAFSCSSLGIETALLNCCTKQCPMCGMFCDNTMETHSKHSSHLHRPRGMTGETYSGTHRMVLEDCPTSLLLPHAFSTTSGMMFNCKDYKQYYPDWEIKPDLNNPGKMFWRYLFVQLAKHCFVRRSDRVYFKDTDYVNFPESWLNITEAEAFQSLQDDKKLKLEGRQRCIQSEETNLGLFTNFDSPQSDTSTVVREDSQSGNDSDAHSDGSTEEDSLSSESSLEGETFTQN